MAEKLQSSNHNQLDHPSTSGSAVHSSQLITDIQHEHQLLKGDNIISPLNGKEQALRLNHPTSDVVFDSEMSDSEGIAECRTEDQLEGFIHTQNTNTESTLKCVVARSEADSVHPPVVQDRESKGEHTLKVLAVSLVCDEDTDDMTIISEKSNETSLTQSATATPKCKIKAPTVPEISKSLEVDFDNESDVVIDIIQTSGDKNLTSKEQLLSHTEENNDSSKLSLVHSNKILLLSPSNNQNVHKSNTFTANISSTERDYPSLSYSWTQNEHDYCYSNMPTLENPRTIESESANDCLHYSSLLECSGYGNACTTNTTWTVDSNIASGRDLTITDYFSIDTSLQLDNSSIWYPNLQAKAMIKSIGFSQINLERLADTGTISGSLFSPQKSRQVERDTRVQERREIFHYTMQNRKTKYEEQKHREATPGAYYNVPNSCLLEKWLRLDTLEVEEINKLLDDITDIIHARKIATQQHKSHWPRYSSVSQLGARKTRRRLFQDLDKVSTSSASVASSHKKDLHKLFSKTLASIKPARESLRDTSVPRSAESHTHYPPVCETSRYITNVRGPNTQTSDNYVAQGLIQSTPTDCSGDKGQSSMIEKMKNKVGHTDTGVEQDNSIRSLRSRSIKIAANMKSSNKKTEKKSQSLTSKPNDTVNCEGHKTERDEIISVQEWIACSEEWMKHPLDRESMLQLF